MLWNFGSVFNPAFPEKIQRILQLNKDFLSKYNENFNYEFIDA